MTDRRDPACKPGPFRSRSISSDRGPSADESDDFRAERRACWYESSSEGLFRVDLTAPLATDLSPDAQIEHVIQHGVLRECNGVMRQILSLGRGRDVADSRLASHELLRTVVSIFVDGGLHLQDVAVGVGAEPLFVSAVGIREEGALVRIWGRCRSGSEHGSPDLHVANALERQKQQIGLDLHDGVGQLLTAVRIRSHELAESSSPCSESIRDECLRLADEAEEALSLLRAITADLSPAGLIQGDSLRTALELLVERTRQVGFDCTLQWRGRFRLPDSQTRVHAFRIVQEALNNAVKHAQAQSIGILVVLDDSTIVLSVADDGVGFAPRPKGGTLGLESLRYRAQILGAELSVDSVIGDGTTVTCRIPYASDVSFSEGLPLII